MVTVHHHLDLQWPWERDDGWAIRNRCTMTKSSVSLEGETPDILQTLACLEVWGVDWVKQEVMCVYLQGGEEGRRNVVWTRVIIRFLRLVLFFGWPTVHLKRISFVNNKKMVLLMVFYIRGALFIWHWTLNTWLLPLLPTGWRSQAKQSLRKRAPPLPFHWTTFKFKCS